MIPIPDTAISAAQGYAEASGIPFGEGLMKNRYIGRTFIEPTPALRQRGVKLKLNPLPDAVRGKRLVVVDDSIVRGHDHPPDRPDAAATPAPRRSTCASSSPPIRWPCFYGIDMSTREELIAAGREVDEVRRFVGADTLAYLPLEDLVEATGAPGRGVLPGLLRRQYPVPVGDETPSKFALEAR